MHNNTQQLCLLNNFKNFGVNTKLLKLDQKSEEQCKVKMNEFYTLKACTVIKALNF